MCAEPTTAAAPRITPPYTPTHDPTPPHQSTKHKGSPLTCHDRPPRAREHPWSGPKARCCPGHVTARPRRRRRPPRRGGRRRAAPCLGGGGRGAPGRGRLRSHLVRGWVVGLVVGLVSDGWSDGWAVQEAVQTAIVISLPPSDLRPPPPRPTTPSTTLSKLK